MPLKLPSRFYPNISNSQIPNFKTNYPNNEDKYLVSTLVVAQNSKRISFNAREKEIGDDVLLRSFQSFLLLKILAGSQKIMDTNWKLFWHVTEIIQIAAL